MMSKFFRRGSAAWLKHFPASAQLKFGSASAQTFFGWTFAASALAPRFTAFDTVRPEQLLWAVFRSYEVNGKLVRVLDRLAVHVKLFIHIHIHIHIHRMSVDIHGYIHILRGPCTYRYFHFPKQMENGKWKMVIHFSFSIFWSKWKMDIHFPFSIFHRSAKIEHTVLFFIFTALHGMQLGIAIPDLNFQSRDSGLWNSQSRDPVGIGVV